MAEQQIRFDDGAAYERMMGNWSRLAGDIFLDWLAPRSGLRWIDIGCGNGAFTELLVERCAPAEVQGVDPSEAQLAFARTRPAARVAKFSPKEASSRDWTLNRKSLFGRRRYHLRRCPRRTRRRIAQEF
jgi:trans-aconitate methyltransferase